MRTYYYIIFISVIAAFAGLLVGYDAGVIADTKDQVMKLFQLTDHEWSTIACISILGALSALPITGVLSRSISRTRLLALVAVGFILGIILTATAHSVLQFISGRFVIGITIGIASFTTPLFIAEIAPRNIRGSLILINGLAITCGQALSFLIGYFAHDINDHSWRYIVWIGILPASCLLLGLIFVPHSPRWVAMKYGMAECQQILRKLRGNNEKIINEELAEIECLLKQPTSRMSFRDLFTKRLFPATFIGIGIGIFQQLSGISAMMYYGPVIFSDAGFTPVKFAILATSAIGLVNLFCTLLTLILVDILGRRTLLITGTLLAGLSLIGVYIVNVNSLHGKWYTFALMSTYIIGYCISLGSLFWVIIAEIFPLNVRGLAMSVATIAEMLTSLLVTFSFLQFLDTFGLARTYLFYSSMCLISCLFVYYFVPETKNVSLEQIEKNLAKGKRARDLGMTETI